MTTKTTDVRGWQRKLGLKVDGNFGPLTGARSDEVYALAYPSGQPVDEESAPPTIPDGSGEHMVDLEQSGRWSFSKNSERRLSTVHPDLQRVARLALALSDVDFGISEGIRSIDTQIVNVRKGASRTYNSRHLHGMAIDVIAYVDGKVSWKSWPYDEIKPVMFRAAAELGIQIRWGGDWDRDGVAKEKGEWDLVHFELPKPKYPDKPEVLAALRDRGLV